MNLECKKKSRMINCQENRLTDTDCIYVVTKKKAYLIRKLKCSIHYYFFF